MGISHEDGEERQWGERILEHAHGIALVDDLKPFSFMRKRLFRR